MIDRLGVLGGAFDPIHLGHLTIAQTALSQFELGKVLFVPTYAPHNAHKVIPTSFEHRCAMIKLALEGVNGCEICEIEKEIEPPTYTVKMLELLKTRNPQFELYLLIGADSLEQIETWHQPDKILKLATLAVAGREGHRWQSHYPFVRLDMPEIDVSATELRNSVKNGKSVRFLVPDGVISYIESNRLYTEA